MSSTASTPGGDPRRPEPAAGAADATGAAQPAEHTAPAEADPGAHSTRLDDGTVVSWQSWSLGERRDSGGREVTPILAEDREVAEYARVGGEESIATAEGAWALDAADGRLGATLPDGRAFVAEAADKPRFSRAKRITVDFGEGAGEPLTILCESQQHYVIEDAAGAKLGQFTGASHGVRRAEIQYDTPAGRALPEERKVFLSWVARRVLEARMVSTTWVLTLVLLLLIAYLAYIWML
ncbi:hypothetical protein [Corynebacterium sphenisci]|uniref:hypothetical protein n=1 Tax=Corynebacterium sphenisci TaxID=191493 RepID=UPI0026DFA3CD|nr:hypothetical protein [Corynebacterium sphenisci]MDO5731632.1 hypothetical protein [Corynebacterium sphenisci]